MATLVCSLDQYSDADLLLEIKRLVQCERETTAAVIASLIELDARRLYLAEGCSSLFTYCTEVLHLSEHAAYGRIKAARTARAFPVILDLLIAGDITLTTVTLLAPHLTEENHAAVLAEARHKTKPHIEEIAARLSPRPAVPTTVRKLPALKAPTPADDAPPLAVPTAVVSPPSRPAAIMPLAPELYKMQITISKETHDKLRRVQDLLRHTTPNADPAVIFDKALTLLLTELERTKVAATERPRPPRAASSGSRHIPASVRRAVWKRDGRRCAFVGTNGRCTETGCLEFHHVVPFAEGGVTTVENLEVRCRAHNQYESEQWFGQRLPMLARDPQEGWGAVLGTRSGPSFGGTPAPLNALGRWK